MLLVACGAVGGRRCCWWPAVLLVAAGAVGGLRSCWWPSVLLAAPGSCACLPFYGLRPLAMRSRTPQPPQSQLTPPQPHAQRAGFSQLAAGGRLMRQDAWQQQAAQRLSHSARRSVEDRPTAIRVCALATRRLPGSHAMPGTGGGDSVERGGASSFVTLDVRLHTSRSAVNIARLSFPRDYPAGTSPYPLSLTGSTFVR